MEKTKTIDLSTVRPKDEKNTDPHCPTFIFGNEDSADKDLGKKFDVKED